MAYDLVIVGLGSGGMVAAEFASTLPIRVAAVERDRVGGDCLWTGCVPSKALLAAAKVAHHMRTAHAFGIEPVEPAIDTAKVLDRIRAVQDRIARTDDAPERFEGELGIDLYRGAARLAGPNAVEVEGHGRLETRYVLLCTGSRPAEPPVPGLAEAGFLTSESIWEIERAPRSLVCLGGGPIAIELAQGFRRLGVDVTVLQRDDRILPRDEPALVDRLVDVLRGEGVDLRLGVEAERVTVEGGLKVVHAAGGERFAAEEIVVGVGRRANVEGLGLEEAGVQVGPRGVVVDASLRTSAEWVYAAGDVAGRWLFTHAAAYEGVRAVRNMFFPGRAKDDYGVPWCTFTDPELAHAGLTAAEARERFGGGDVEVHRHELARSDRARADGSDAGEILVVTHKGRVVGAHALAASAGELIHELALAIDQRLRLADLGSLIHVYPTLSTEIGRLGGEAAFGAARKYKFLVRSKAS
ncbi:MAG TPA: FAD-dependent oxidoreductase [Solirubrobacteraceae bacterium]|nr:FAD-dependent oxidoreductase [Solirubrobacteraceae bacterium]